jgi:very-short-patch-repair endonuclease
VHRSLLPEDEVTVLDGIPVTTVPRTLLDLTAVVSRRQLERALNEAEILRITDPLSVPELLSRHPQRRGTAMLRAIFAEEAALNGITRSELEERFVTLLDTHGLPRPRFNVDLLVRGHHFNVDCLWSGERLIVELDGRKFHRTVRAFEVDRERDRLLLSAGWRVMRLTWRQLRDGATEVAADLRGLLSTPTL